MRSGQDSAAAANRGDQMLRLILLLVATFVGTSAFARDCKFAPGDYVDVDLGLGQSAGYVVSVTPEYCWVDVRLLAAPGVEFSWRTTQYDEEEVAPLLGAPPYDKPYGCPYAVGERYDYVADNGQTYAAEVVTVDDHCGLSVAYWTGQQLTTAGTQWRQLSPATLPWPDTILSSDDAGACPAGGLASDYEGAQKMVEFAIAREVVIQTQRPMSVYFDRVREGEAVVAEPGSIHQTRNPEAKLGTTIQSYRVKVTLCEPATPTASLARFELDYSCYIDRFGDFACRRDATRPLF